MTCVSGSRRDPDRSSDVTVSLGDCSADNPLSASVYNCVFGHSRGSWSPSGRVDVSGHVSDPRGFRNSVPCDSSWSGVSTDSSCVYFGGDFSFHHYLHLRSFFLLKGGFSSGFSCRRYPDRVFFVSRGGSSGASGSSDPSGSFGPSGSFRP